MLNINRKSISLKKTFLVTLLALPAIGATVQAQGNTPSADSGKELNLFSARHYQTDEALYKNFTAKTGIKINRIEGNNEALIERLRSEGKNSKADVVLLVDAARLWNGQIEGLFQPIKSPILTKRIPEYLRSKDEPEGNYWFGFSTRARVIFYNKEKVKPEEVRNYEDLASPNMKGKVCTRSGAHPYMLSLVGSVSERLGEAKAQEWANSLVQNLARKPRGGDTDQIRAVATGECLVALSNTYYYVRLMKSNKPEDKEVVSKVGFVWPNQGNGGTHVNISGGAVARYAPNKDAAIQFLEYLASDEAQRYFAEGNNEWPAVPTVVTQNAELNSLGKYKADPTPLGSIGRAQIAAQRIVDKAGWR